MNLVLFNSELGIEIQRFIITNSNNQTKQKNMHLSSASSLNNYCQKTASFISSRANKYIYFGIIQKVMTEA